jgi:potassium-transporting ATPase KdpC subunit
MKKVWLFFRPVLISFAVLTLLCGIVYPGVVTGIAQLFFKDRANGSMITVRLNNGQVVKYGSELIAQEFTEAKYMIGRPAGATNLSAVSESEKLRVQERLNWLQSLDPDNHSLIPADLVTASGSGVDPNISPEAAEWQVARIARERGIGEDRVRQIVSKCLTRKFLGIWGSAGVNVLRVNLMLDGLL